MRKRGINHQLVKSNKSSIFGFMFPKPFTCKLMMIKRVTSEVLPIANLCIHVSLRSHVSLNTFHAVMVFLIESSFISYYLMISGKRKLHFFIRYKGISSCDIFSSLQSNIFHLYFQYQDQE